MMDLKALRPKIEAKLMELMKARDWTPVGDGLWYQLYQKGDIRIELKADEIYPFQGSRYPDGYWIKIDSRPARRFKVKIDGDSFAIDEKKLDKKIDEICAMIRERRAGVVRREKEAIEDEKRAVELAAKVGKLLPLYEVTPVNKNLAEVELPGGDVCVAANTDGYSVRVNFSLITQEAELSTLIKTLAEFS